jgi:hypothetical protein
LPVPLDEIASALGITAVLTHHTGNYLGMLLAEDDRSAGVISLRSGLQPGRRNFTFGHEIGHFVSIHHRAPAGGFKCVAKGLGAKRADHPWATLDRFDRMEIEANEFAIALLVPTTEYVAERKAMHGCDLAHVENLSHRFGTSKEAMARIYVDTAPEEIAIILSQAGRVRRVIPKSKFPYMGLSSGAPVPGRSLTAKFAGSKPAGFCSDLLTTQADAWLERSTGVELFEQVQVLRDGWVMTMLAIERPDEEERYEQDLMERRWDGPKFAYGR